MYKKLLIILCVHIRIHIPATDMCYSLQSQFHLQTEHIILSKDTQKEKVSKQRKTSVFYAGVSATLQRQVFCFFQQYFSLDFSLKRMNTDTVHDKLFMVMQQQKLK